MNNIVVFDGICNFCSRTVLYIIKRDPKSIFHFVAMQSNTGQELLKQYGMDPSNVKTFLLLKNGKAYLRSNAALEIAMAFQGLWKLLGVFRLIPEFIRDWLYDIIADNRYRWFGKKKSCMVPPDDVRERFLNEKI